MKQTAIYAALQFIMAQTGYRDTQLPIDGDAWAQSDQAAWQVLATDKLNVPPHIAHEVPTSLEVLSTYKSVIPEWLDLVKAAGEHAAMIEGETYEPPAGSTDEDADDEGEGDLDGDLGQDADAPVDDPQEPVADSDAPATVGETLALAADAVAGAEPAADAVADAVAADAVADAEEQADEAGAAEGV